MKYIEAIAKINSVLDISGSLLSKKNKKTLLIYQRNFRFASKYSEQPDSRYTKQCIQHFRTLIKAIIDDLNDDDTTCNCCGNWICFCSTGQD